MADEYNAELHKEQHRQQMEKLAEIYAQVKETNGRTRVLETKVAVLEERNPGKQGGIAGTIGGVIAGFIAGFVK